MSEQNVVEEEPLTPEEVPEGSKKSGKLKKILIIVTPIILLIVGAVYFYMFVISAPKAEKGVVAEQSKPKAVVDLDHNAYLDIDPITVGLSPSGPKREFLRIDLTLRISSDEESKAIMEKIPVIKDSLIVFLRSLRATDFNSSSSTIYLKEEIPVLATGKVNYRKIIEMAKIEVDEQTKNLQILIPYKTIEPVKEQMQQVFLGDKFGNDIEWEQTLLKSIYDVEFPIEAVITNRLSTVEELAKLGIGDTFVLEHLKDQDIKVRSGTVDLFTGKIGKVGSKLAVGLKNFVEE